MKSILLIEDDPFLIDIYSTKLKETGYKVEVATDGKTGIEKLKEKIPDVLLLDIVLPEVNGWQVLEAIQNKKEFKDLKIIVLSNLGQKEEIEKGLKFGAIKYLVKAHYTPSEVIEEIKNLL